MIQGISKIFEKISGSRRNLEFFIGSNTPFIGNSKPTNSPFVGHNKPIGRTGGFTLVELVITLMVVAILATFAVPSMRGIIQDNRLATLSNDLISDLSFTRSEAVKRAANVGICPTTSGTACEGIDWNTGRLVYGLNDGVFTVLRYREALTTNTLSTITVPTKLEFNSRGLPLGLPQTIVSYSLCDTRGPTKGRMILISPAGQASVSTNPPSGC